MPEVALRPLNTLPIRLGLDGKQYEAIDADVIARLAFMQIGDPELRATIAANFVNALAAWTGEPGSDEEFRGAKATLIARGTESLASLYDVDGPVRNLPSPPVFLSVSAEPAPATTIAEAHKWVLTWETAASEDLIVTEIVTEPYVQPVAEATAFERALLAADANAIALTPIESAIHAVAIPNGPASGSAVIEGDRAAVSAFTVRNQGLPDGFVYAIASQSELLAPFLERHEELTASLDDIAKLSPSRVEVWYEFGAPLTQRLPVVLVLEQFDGPLVLGAIDQWRAQTLAPPDGEMIFVVTAARMRLNRVVVR